MMKKQVTRVTKKKRMTENVVIDDNDFRFPYPSYHGLRRSTRVLSKANPAILAFLFWARRRNVPPTENKEVEKSKRIKP